MTIARLAATALLLAVAIPSTADARHYRHHAGNHHKHATHTLRHRPEGRHSPGKRGLRASAPRPAPSHPGFGVERASGGLVTVQTAAGQITVSPAIAGRMTAFIADVVARGFRGPVGCYASGGHVARSRHYSGNACDFAQTGWGKTVKPMYTVADLAARHGLRDGCSFGDCGHIDDGGAARQVRAPRRARVAWGQQ